ncbi:MAG: helix-turn-helix transcriptional regulator [Firmicutes bacterium]|nr:helix-turn-helix transcriptional regulator [Bacillota bacterium]MBR2593510.1 helix-turn-helix transcriptional regulator [Bacillota bacterium]
MVDYKLIGSRIKSGRIMKGLTQEYVAEKAKITTVYLSKIENGHVRPTIDVLDSICETLNYDLGHIFTYISPASDKYQNEPIVKLFHELKPEVKPVALNLLKELKKLG